ncbi:MAG: hypothetical protein ACTTHG_02965 [Treponemataceae bacterium]
MSKVSKVVFVENGTRIIQGVKPTLSAKIALLVASCAISRLKKEVGHSASYSALSHMINNNQAESLSNLEKPKIAVGLEPKALTPTESVVKAEKKSKLNLPKLSKTGALKKSKTKKE